ncbi:MAG: methyltransferase [Rickettsiaceae bacterium]|nr:methyltransferase [Rickettsiaceae bacterium]
MYPPVGKSSAIFADYLIKNDLIKGKVIVEIRSGCMPIGIFAAKNGAKRAVGLDSNVDALRCAQENVIGNSLAGRSSVLTGDNITKDLKEYNGKIDVLFTNLPWDEISQRDYNKIPKDRKALSNSFYDVNNQFITSILTEGYNLLSKNGKLYITATDRVLPRIDKVCQKTNRNYKVVVQEAHKNGNMHYILEFSAAK